MEEQLTKIDMIRERIDVSFAQAKAALDRAEGDVIKAIINLEDEMTTNGKWTEEIQVKGNEILDKVKELIRKGNVTKIRIKKNERILLDIPVTVGAVGAILAPYITAIGVLAGVVAHCTLEIHRPEPHPIQPQTSTEIK